MHGATIKITFSSYISVFSQVCFTTEKCRFRFLPHLTKTSNIFIISFCVTPSATESLAELLFTVPYGA
jgi:hypothetical protein